MKSCLSLLLFMALSSGCVEKGRPLVTERSPIFDTKPSSQAKPAEQTQSNSQSKSISQAKPMTTARAVSKAPAKRPVIKPRRRPQEYLVRRGDTLYSIAWRFELDHAGLARANRISTPYTIYPGQKLRLKSVKYPPRALAKRKPVAKPRVIAKRPPQPTRSPPSGWVWPTDTKPVREFSSKNRGLDFAFSKGSKKGIKAAGSGVVVYAGNGIGAFERLIIVRHDEKFLSAYNFNGSFMVNEQQRVKAGQKLADIKETGRNSQKMHFELRKDGKPIDPRSVLN